MTNYLTAVGVQQVNITIPTGATSQTATITATGSGAFLVNQGFTSGADVGSTGMPRIEFTNSTTITAFRNTSSATLTCAINGSIVDGDTTNLIKSVQKGTITQGATTTATATITAVTNANAATHWLGSIANQTGTIAQNTIWPVLSLSGTTVTSTQQFTSNTSNVHGFEVIEFQGAALNQSVQNFAFNASNNATTATTTITSVVRNNSFVLQAGWNSANDTSWNTDQASIQLTAATTVTYTWNTAGFSNCRINGSVIELIAGLLAQNVQRGTLTITASTSGTVTITSAATAQTLANFLFNTTTGATQAITTNVHKLTQTNATTLTGSVNTSGTGNGSYEAITFPAFVSGVTAIAWFPSYPNQVPFFNQGWPSGQSFGFVTPYIAPAPPSPWLPIYNDQARPNLKVQRDFFFSPILPLNLPILWQAEFPNQAPLSIPKLPSGAVEPIPPLNFPMPWLPQYTDLPRPNLKVQRDFVFPPVFPLNFPLPWLPTYPDMARRPQPVKGPSHFEPVQPLALPLPWLPSYPTSARLGQSIQNTNQLFNIGVILSFVAFTQWISFDGL